MANDVAIRPVVILGPTAGGKSELAVALAEALGGEVIGADSMQVYKHLDAGTAKPPAELRGRVPHHLIDIVEATERFTVADWLARAEALIVDLQGSGICPILVGGTNLYLRSLLEGLFDAPGHDPVFRAGLEVASSGELHQRLRAVDPDAAERIHPNDRKKLVRALEVFHLTGKPISEFQTQWAEPTASSMTTEAGYRFDPVLIGLDWPTELINRRINRRVRDMYFPQNASDESSREGSEVIAQSLPDEVRYLAERGLLGPQAREALGYKQVLAHLGGEYSIEDAFEKTKILTRRFAKTQRTWLRRFRGVHWLPAGELDHDALVAQALAAARTRNDIAG